MRGLGALWIGASLTVALAGCNTLVPHPKGVQIAEKPSEAPKAADARKLTIRWSEPDDHGGSRRVMEVHAARGDLKVDSQSGRFYDTDGLLYRADKPAARMEAAQVDALKDRNTVVASGGVSLTTLSSPASRVTADRMVWLAESNQVTAVGNVRFHGKLNGQNDERVTGGPFPRVELNTELEEIVIPDPEMNVMKRLPKPILAAMTLAGLPAMPSLAKQDPAEPKRVQFNNAVLTGFKNAKSIPASHWIVTGPNTTLTMPDSKTGGKSELKSPIITVFIKPKSRNDIQRAVAEGPVVLVQTSPHKAKDANGTERDLGLQRVVIHGTKLEYVVADNEWRMTGPITFKGTRPTDDPKIQEVIQGTANKAVYDDQKLILKMDGVNASIDMPNKLAAPAPVLADHITIEFGKADYEFEITNDSPDSGKLQIQPNPPAKPEKKDKKPNPTTAQRSAPASRRVG